MTQELPGFDPAAATLEQREAAEEIQRDRNLAGQPLGAIWQSLMPSPGAARRIARVGAHCRFDSVLTAHQREVAILAAACALDFEYEARYHQTYAANLGVAAGVIADTMAGRLAQLPDEFRFVAELARCVALGAPADGALATARARLGERGAVDLVATAAYYAMLHRISGALLPPAPPA